MDALVILILKELCILYAETLKNIKYIGLGVSCPTTNKLRQQAQAFP